MAGRPVLEEVERKLREELGGEEWVYDQLADGKTVGQVAEQLGISRRYLYRWRDRKGFKEHRKPLWEEAIRMSAGAQAEKGLQDLEDLDEVDPETGRKRIPMSSEVQLAGSRARYRQWLASKYDPDQFGDRSAVELNFSLGEMHIQALQRDRQVPTLEAVEGEDYMIEPEGDEGDPVEEAGSDAQALEHQALPTPSEPEETSDDELADLLA